MEGNKGSVNGDAIRPAGLLARGIFSGAGLAALAVLSRLFG
jgi:hypothetical protein